MGVGWLVLLSGLVAAFISVLYPRFLNWLARPRLVLEFPGAEPGCEMPSPVRGTTTPVENHLRIRIRNVGRRTAHNVSICGTLLRYSISEEPDVEFGEEVLDLKLAMTDDVMAFRLAPGAHRYVDLCHIRRRGSDLKLHWDFVQKPMARSGRNFGPGRYRLHIFASSDNSESMAGDVIFSWDGTFEGLHATGFARS